MERAELSCKVVLVGDSGCGKTALVHRFVSDSHTQIYTPTGFERYTANYSLGGYTIHYTLWDTSGSSAYDSVRPLAYKDASVFLLCFTVASPDTLRSALNKWYPEIREHSGTSIPVILCGCQSDLRSDPQTMLALAQLEKKPVTAEQALAVSRQIHATTYVETSARCCPRTVRDAFEVAALAAQGRLNKNHSLLRNVSAAKNNSKELNRAARNCALM